MFEETWSGGFVETKSGEKRDEAKVGEFFRLLETVHRLVYAKDIVLRKGRRLRRERTADEN
jgi:hypothetical protein